MKKLIPTIGMALLSAAMLGTTTFAWFSANGSASATGLQISAKASASLLVSNKSGSGFAASTTLTDANLEARIAAKGEENQYVLDPATQKVEGTYEFKKLTGDDQKHVKPDGSIMTDYTAEYVDTSVDFVKSAIYLLYAGSAAGEVSIDATLSGPSPATADTIWKAIHLDLVGGADEVYSFTFGALGVAETSDSNVAVSDGTEKKLDIYMWVEGTDGNCYNGAALVGTGYSLALAFNVVEAE